MVSAVVRLNDETGEWALQAKLRSDDLGVVEIIGRTTTSEGLRFRPKQALESINWDDALWAIDEGRGATFELPGVTVIVQRYTGSSWVL